MRTFISTNLPERPLNRISCWSTSTFAPGARLSLLRFLRARLREQRYRRRDDLPLAAIRPQRRLRTRHFRRSPAALLRRQLSDSESMGIRISPFMLAFSGPPFNITTSQDINGDSIFIKNDRPSFAPAGETGAKYLSPQSTEISIQTPAVAEARIPINYGQCTGPVQPQSAELARPSVLGPKVEGQLRRRKLLVAAVAGPAAVVEVVVPGFIGFGGRGGGPPGAGGSAPSHRYNLTLNAQARNLFNNVNYAAPIGVARTNLRPIYGPWWRLRWGLPVRESPYRSASRIQFLEPIGRDPGHAFRLAWVAHTFRGQQKPSVSAGTQRLFDFQP